MRRSSVPLRRLFLHTVDGSEIRLTVEVGSLSHYFLGFYTYQVVQDF